MMKNFPEIVDKVMPNRGKTTAISNTMQNIEIMYMTLKLKQLFRFMRIPETTTLVR